MVHGVRLAVDVGSVRIGVAVSDPECILATPLVTVPQGDGDQDVVAALVAEHHAVEVVVGLPLHMSGKESPSSELAREWAAGLQPLVGDIPIVLVDERLTTVLATRALQSSGRKTKTHRPVIDQAAAVSLLQSHLDRIRNLT